MQITSLELATDSLIVAVAVAGVMPLRHIAPLSLLFGLFDGLASLVGPMLHTQVPNSGWLAPTILIFWGLLIVLNLSTLGRFSGSLGCAYALPPVLALDNLVVPDPDWIAAGFVSGGMALLGFGFGCLCFRSRFAPHVDRRWLGLPLAIAGGLLLFS